MPTERLRTIKPSGQGGDYTSLLAWEAGEQADLVTADEIRIGEIQGDWSGGADAQTVSTVIDGWTTDATRYGIVRVVGTARHGGKFDATKYDLTSTVSGSTLSVLEDYFRFDGLQVEARRSTSSTFTAVTITAGAGLVVFNACIAALRVNTTGAKHGFTVNIAGHTVVFTNCLAFRETGITTTGNGFTCTSGTLRAYNCVAINLLSGWGFRRAAGTFVAKNCVSQNNGTPSSDNWNGTFSAASTNNCADAGTPPGSNAVTGTVNFVDEGAGDCHLDAGDTVAKGAGTDLSADADWPFSTDIDGQTRAVPWDLGVDEFAGGSLLLSPRRNQRALLIR